MHMNQYILNEVYRVCLITHDFFHYVSRELKVGVPTDLISNTALLYAFNRHVESVQRNAAGNRPRYQEDYGRFELYPTPARLLTGKETCTCPRYVEWLSESGEMKRFTYNAINTITQVTENKKSKSIPTMGFYMKYVPLTVFECFLIGGRAANVIRLGKKFVPVRALYQRLERVDIHEEGEFVPSHPVNVADLPEGTRTLECAMEVIPPVPIYSTCRLRGRYLTGYAGNQRYTIALPEEERYPAVFGTHVASTHH